MVLNKRIILFLSIFILVLNLRQNTHAQIKRFYDKEGIEKSPNNTLKGQHPITKSNIKKVKKRFSKDLKILISALPFIFIWFFLSLGLHSRESGYPDNLTPIGDFVPYNDPVHNKNMSEKIKRQENSTRITPIR